VGAHPDFTYAAFEHDVDGGSRITTVVLETRAQEIFGALGITDYMKVGAVSGRELVGREVRHPLSARGLPVIPADFIRGDAGSGFVHIVPEYGADDLKVARQYGLGGASVLDAQGRFTPLAGEFNGLELGEGERAILRHLSRSGALAALHQYDYPHCWRCAGPLIMQSTPQWFVRLDHREEEGGMTLREKALLEAQVVNWLPSESRRQISGMIESRSDWCISRQRTWGVPIPAFSCLACGAAILSAEIIRHVRDLVGIYGSAIWFERSTPELLPASFSCQCCGSHEFSKDEHILDVWFESGASWQSVLIADHRLSFPADLYVEGSDQHRGWFQLSLLPALASRGRAPYNSVLTHGFVLNERHERMTRAHGDFITLRDALEKAPVDLIRLYFSSVDTTNDIPLSLDTFQTVEPQYRTIRNTFRYLLGNLYDFVFREDAIHLDDLHPLDLWALCRLHELISEVSDGYSTFRFHAASSRIHDFCNDF
jgi:isoleucyl-tRNA synthetase